MSAETEALLTKLATIPDVGYKLGTFVTMDGVLAVVNVGDRSVSIPCVGFYPPVEGMTVQLERRNGSLIATGPASQLPPLGTITAGGSPKCSVEAGGVIYVLAYRDGYVPTVGDPVEINWATGVIQGKLSVAPVAAVEVTNPGGQGGSFTDLLVMAADSGSFIGHWWTSDVYNGDSNTGAWFYGERIRDALRGTVPTKAEIFLNPRQASGGSPRVGLHSSASKPGGNVSVSAQIDLEPRSGWVQIPVAWALALRDNIGGIGVTPSGYTVWRGQASDALSGALRFSGTR